MMIPKSVTDGWEAEVNDLKSALADAQERLGALATGHLRVQHAAFNKHEQLQAALAAEKEKRLEAESKVRKLREVGWDVLRWFNSRSAGFKARCSSVIFKRLGTAIFETADKEG